ncbi:DUF6146 family protein [Maribacter stanieri]|uniref:Lipoprotein n=1 Tax=Maribacter stanieri TaxID=440514 RepID=A0A1I6JZX9_9FLAO|nr:DUF6146 family protein [Maribacter stanieri]SFR84555.1 hypothetical protein SAMN04488010_3307 [Maribacter stanieri]|tara:strand:+ start:4565 stop:5023 length:459 start_codon:yes stop_codon:yes gene_type:complete
MKKNTFYSLLILSVTTLLFINCSTTKDSLSITESEENTFKQVQEDTITISSEKTEYEIIIIEPGFTTWLSSIAKPEGYYSQNFLENRNNIMVLEWNNRVLQPSRFNPNLYELRIDYSQQIDYGYEVNYKLYNYFIYFQRKYNQRLGPFVPRI